MEQIAQSCIIPVKYEWGIQRITVEKTNLHCLNCGEKSVWIETGDGDHYEGPNHYCGTCTSVFTVPSLRVDTKNPQEKQICEAIKKG
jgi:hypothetical protein